ncbi:L-aspartate oxidase [Gracilibacillus alcaliphilus]|uniref:L-aspartate oxidase n=1 Tax=Gracilibacillus alcaliphilus TaxID=1401441 RepID=UPI001956FE0A|nr:L-aspartate oxidase [Gracilibacillus alcaliphilus]MBM7676763.1 L-aspartate oxidase [Gracilibacillus alcaliphilus]
MRQTDVLIIGSGVAAFQLANKLRHDINVIIITKSMITETNSYLAQGGIAAALSDQDNSAKHFKDTLEAGRYHNDPEAVKTLTSEAPALIKALQQQGCLFDKDKQGQLLLGLEGAHSEKRIVHGGGDATGKTLMDFLIAYTSSHVEILENYYVYELLVKNNRCVGVKAKGSDQQVEIFAARHIILATGGCGQLYRYSSNAETATGDGIALAYLAGADITDMEFIQFHPTLLYANGKTHGLVSEAVRGEGGRLITADGNELMRDVHPLSDLAPRHIVSQTIYQSLSRGEQVYLDITHVKNFTARFPTIAQLCRKNHIDLTSKQIPVVPGSHFLMGGIKTDVIGQSSLPGLYALGETACTGVHGANRLASNSLLEGLFAGKKLAEWLNKQDYTWDLPHDIEGKSKKSELACLPNLHDIKHSMMERVGIVRSHNGLLAQKNWLNSFQLEEYRHVNLDAATTETITRFFMLVTAALITNGALQRTESRGGHYRVDFPCEDNNNWRQHQLIQRLGRRLEKQDEQTKIKTAT